MVPLARNAPAHGELVARQRSRRAERRDVDLESSTPVLPRQLPKGSLERLRRDDELDHFLGQGTRFHRFSGGLLKRFCGARDDRAQAHTDVRNHDPLWSERRQAHVPA